MAKPETLEEAIEIIADMTREVEKLEGRVEDLGIELSAAEGERDDALGELEEIKAPGNLQDAADAVIAETTRPVGDINAVTLRDTPAARRALRALSDAAGRAI